MSNIDSFTPSDLEQELRRKFEVIEHQIRIGPNTFELIHPRSADDLISEEDFNQDERLPYWAEIWPSAYALAIWLSGLCIASNAVASQKQQPLGFSNGSFFGTQQPRLLELGCGCGLSVLAALAAGYQVTAIDYYAEALQFVRLNALRNHLPAPQVRVVDWRRYPSDLTNFDVVVAADVLYERDYCRLVARAFKQSLRPGGLGILTDPQRSKAEAFPGECQKLGLAVSSPKVLGRLSVPGGDPSVRQTINLFEIKSND